MSLAKGARNLGVQIREGVQVSSVNKKNGFVSGVETSEGPISCEILVNCAGQWARALGARDGVNIPLHSAEHFYIVTEAIEGVHPMLPVMRDPDGFIYFKEEVGGLVMGGFEPVAKPWGMEGIPDKFEFQLLPEDWDQFQPLMEAAMHRVPALETAGVKILLNGPESFTPDGNFILGEAPEIRNYFVAAGFNSAGIANAGGAGKLLAEWIAGGEAPMDLFEVDIRRFGAFAADAQWLKARTVETLGLHYAMRWPRHELESGRPQRVSPLYSKLKSKGGPVRLQIWLGARQLLRPEDGVHARPTELARRRHRRAAGDPQRRRHSRPDLVRQAARARARRSGAPRPGVRQPHRQAHLHRDAQPQRRLRKRRHGAALGGRRLPHRHRLGAAGSRPCLASPQPETRRGGDGRRRHRRVVGPLGPGASCFEFFFQGLIPGSARVVAASYVGGPGSEIYVPVAEAVGLYDRLWAAGKDLGLKDCGYYALDALRIEAGRRAFGPELSPDCTPYEAGLAFAVRPELRKPPARLAKQLLMFTFPATELFAWGGEPILRDGKPAGELSSVGYSATLGCMVGMGFVHAEEIGGSYEIEVSGTRVPAQASLRAPWPG